MLVLAAKNGCKAVKLVSACARSAFSDANDAANMPRPSWLSSETGVLRQLLVKKQLEQREVESNIQPCLASTVKLALGLVPHIFERIGRCCLETSVANA